MPSSRKPDVELSMLQGEKVRQLGCAQTDATCGLTCSHVLNNANAKVLVQHGVQTTHCASQQACQLLKGHIGAEVDTVLQAKMPAVGLQLVQARLVLRPSTATYQLEPGCQHCTVCSFDTNFSD